MEAGALRAPAALNRISVTAPLLRLRSDEQLVALFRAGNDAAFSVIHDRYRQRLFAYSRQMLGGSRQDAEDALQDVFLRAYSSLRSNDRPLSLRAWLYRVAHNRCIDHLRRPTPPAADLFDTSRKPLHDPMDEAVRREDLRQLVEDVRRLPDQQRSALLMREMDGMSYAELSEALGVSLQAVKSLLVRARIGLVEAVEARDTACSEIRLDLADAFDRGVRASGLARRHLRDCDGCVAYRTQLRVVRHGLSVLAPSGSGPFTALLKLAGLGGAGSAGAASAGGAGAAGSGTLAAATTGTVAKVAAVVCCAALTATSAVEVRDRIVGSSDAAKAAAERAPSAASHGRAARALSRSPALAASVAMAVPARAKAAAKRPTRLSDNAAAGRYTRSVPVQDLAAGAIPEPAPTSQAQVDTSTGGASAPGEEDGFGYGVDGLTPKASPKTTTLEPDPALVPSSGASQPDGSHGTPAGVTVSGGDSGTTATGGGAESASGSMPPG
jgi:RNA polymerase sigma factor (sigma-70 family)